MSNRTTEMNSMAAIHFNSELRYSKSLIHYLALCYASLEFRTFRQK